MKNEDEVIGSIRNISTVDVVGVNWSEYTFEEQLYLVRNASVIIGMHGAGITVRKYLHRYEGLNEINNFNKADPDIFI